jgi:putative inorganic carbon (hco3(-)) transporter
MGFLFTCLYLLLAHLSPAEVVPGLAPLRLELWIGLCALLTAIAGIPQNHSVFRIPQVYLALGLIWAVGFSRLANHFLGASASAVLSIMPAVTALYLILFVVNTPAKLRTVSAILVLIGLYFTIHGGIAYFTDPQHSLLVLAQPVEDDFGLVQWSLRMRATGFLNDPNDLAQFLLVAIALLGTNWRRGGMTRIAGAILPGVIMIGGIFMTKSRGGFLGLMSLFLLALSDRVGRAKAAVLAAVTGIALFALRFTGGRAITLEAGVDRLNIWRDGWGMFKGSPLWGVGFGWFYKFAGRMTAHNSFILCFTELGLLGYFFWIALIVLSYYQLNAIRRMEPKNAIEAEAISMAASVRLALSTFLVTGWFLSRTYSMTFYILVGMSASLTLIMGAQRGTFLLPSKLTWFRSTLLVEFGSILLVYIVLKVRIFAL